MMKKPSLAQFFYRILQGAEGKSLFLGVD